MRNVKLVTETENEKIKLRKSIKDKEKGADFSSKSPPLDPPLLVTARKV